jgi:hypothetical protein
VLREPHLDYVKEDLFMGRQLLFPIQDVGGVLQNIELGRA